MFFKVIGSYFSNVLINMYNFMFLICIDFVDKMYSEMVLGVFSLLVIVFVYVFVLFVVVVLSMNVFGGYVNFVVIFGVFVGGSVLVLCVIFYWIV